MTKKTFLSALLVLTLLSSSGLASAYYYSNYGHVVRPVGADRYLQAAPYYIEPGTGLTQYFQAYWRLNSNGYTTGSPGGNTWALARGNCGGTWVNSSWQAPSSNANTATAKAWCSSIVNAGPGDAYGRVASDGYSSFTY